MSDEMVKVNMESATARYLALGVDDGVTKDADNRFEIRANGKLEWGDGTSAQDVTLERTGPGQLLLTGKLSQTIPITNVTDSTLAVTAAQSGSIFTLNRAAGIAVTLPAATGSGASFRFFVGTTVTSNTSTIKVANSSDTMSGVAFQAADGGSTSNAWETAASSDTITFDGSTTGGVKGDYVELIDVASTLWFVRLMGSATGTEATPFSATV